jgi:hypothetical protein
MLGGSLLWAWVLAGWQDGGVGEPLLPDTTTDESEVGWGDDSAVDDADGEGRDGEGSDEARLIAERPPHYDRD